MVETGFSLSSTISYATNYPCQFTIRYLGNQPDAEAESLPPLPEKIDLASIFDRRYYSQAEWVAQDPFGLEGF